MKKNWKRIVVVLLGVLAIGAGAVGLIFQNELRTISHMKQINEHPFYEMTYYGDYGNRELAEQGVDSDEALVSFVTRRLLKGLPLQVNVDGACSAFYVQSPNQEYLMGRNFDYHPSTAMLVKTNPKEGYRSISMVNLNHIGYSTDWQPDSMLNKVAALAAPYIPLDGMNEKGFDMNSSGETGYHFFLADAQGNSAVIEYIDNEMRVLHNTEENPYLAATNFSLTTKEQNGGGKDRYEIIQNGLEKTAGIMSREDAMELLDEVQFDNLKATNGDETNIYYNCSTQWSAVYNLTDKVVKICIGTDYSEEYEYTFWE